jgi:type II secretory pathway pseudopilin PulG
MTMKPDLLGYVMHALPPQEEREVEALLEAQPELRTELKRLRPLLNALDTQEEYEPSKDLVFRTLRSVASAHSQNELDQKTDKHKPSKTGVHQLPGLEPWKPSELEAMPTNWRRADAWALIAIILMIVIAIPPVLQYVRDRAMQTECRDNMRQLHLALNGYMQANNGRIPSLSMDGPTARAGMYATILKESGLWGERLRLGCPPNSPTQPESLINVKAHSDSDTDYWKKFAGSYAYHLGYIQMVDGNPQLFALKVGDGDTLPILADRPARFGEVQNWAVANSPNHGCRGQNVLHLGGHVAFLPYRSAINGDDRDIFRNQDNQPHASKDKFDCVLGPSEATPTSTPHIPVD